MARPKRLMRPVRKNLAVPEDIAARVDLELFSELEARVPHGAWSKFVTELIREHYKKKERIQAFAASAEATIRTCKGDAEFLHNQTDNLMEDALTKEGFGQGVELINNTSRWYA